MAIRDAVSTVFTPQSTKVWHKLALVAATLVLPVTALNWLLLSAYREQIRFAHHEIEGEVYLQPLRRFAEHVIEHRGLANAALQGNAMSKRELLSKQSEIEDDIKVVNAIDQEVGAALRTSEKWAAIRAAWADLKRKASNLTVEKSFDQHTRLVSETIALFGTVGAESKLFFDPISVSYYFMDTMTNRIPSEADYLGQIRDSAVTCALKRQATPAEQAQLLLLIGQSTPYRQAIDSNMRSVFRSFASYENQLKATAADHQIAADELIALVKGKILSFGSDKLDADPEEIAAFGQRAIATGFRLYDESAPNLNVLLQGRIEEARSRVFFGVFCSIAGILFTLLVGFKVAQGITRQVRSISSLIGQIDIGDYQARAEVTSADELGTLAASLNTMLDNTLVLVQSRAERDAIQNAIVKLLDEVSGVAEGDLTRETVVTDDITGSIADAFNYMIYQLRRIISDVHDATLQVGTSAHEIHVTTLRLVEGSETQARKILGTSAAIEEIALRIQQVSENATASSAVAEQALANATRGNLAVQNTIEGMNRIRDQAQETAKRIKRLGESSNEIGQIIQLIDDIADRTSILALNASIQAAAAGEAGRGFAVVAEEVERLAERSTDATKKIATLIKTIQSETNEAVGSMEKSIHEVVEGSKLAIQAGKSLEEIGTVSHRLVQLIQSISQASRHQALGSEAIAKSMSEISQITQETAAGTHHAAESVQVLAGLAEALRNSVSTFRLPGRTWPTENGPATTNGHGCVEPNGHELERNGNRSGEFRRIPAHA